MKIVLNKNTYFFLQLSLICVLVGVFCSFLLPSKFYNDAEIIVNDPYNQIGFFGGYEFSILFYHYTLLNKLPYFLVAVIQLPILFYILYRIGVPSNLTQLTVKNVLVYISFFLIGLFICIPSKEFINFSYLAIIVFLFKSKKYSLKKSVLIAFLLFIIISVFFRPYYVFIPIFSTAMYFFTFIKSKNKSINMLILGSFIAVFLSLAHGFVKGEYISESTREMHNFDRLGSEEAQSMIQSPIPTDTWYGETFGIVYGYISVNIPITGFKHFLKPQVVAFIIWQLLLFFILFKRFKDSVTYRKILNYELWMFLFIFSYFIVQGLFEPDLGSAIRHKIGIFPFIYFALYYDKFIKSK